MDAKIPTRVGLEAREVVLYCDSMSAIHLSKNPIFYSRSKHVDVKYHWIREKLEEKLFLLKKVHTDNNKSNMMTKALPMMKLDACRRKAGMMNLPT